MLLKFIFSLFFFSIIHAEIITDEPSLILNEKGKYTTKYIPHNIDRYISKLETNIKYIITRNKEFFLKYCSSKECLFHIEDADFVEEMNGGKADYIIKEPHFLNLTFINFHTINKKDNGIMYIVSVSENIGKIIQQYDITKKLVCNKINGNKCKIVYGKSSRILFESEEDFIYNTILKISHNKLVKEFNDY